MGIATASFVVRLWFPLGSAQVANLKPWQWPQFLAMFGLGVISARRGWLAPVLDRLRRGCGLAALAATLSFPLLVLVASAVGLPADLELFLGGWRWQAAAAAVAGGYWPSAPHCGCSASPGVTLVPAAASPRRWSGARTAPSWCRAPC